MSEQFTPGQRLTLAHDDGTVLVGTVGTAGFLLVAVIGTSYPLSHFERNGFRVTHIDGEPVPAAPTLPTEPGWYLDTDNGVWELSGSGDWRYDAEKKDVELAREYAPFTRLVPEGENRAAIAREVIDWMVEMLSITGYAAGLARKHFGVTEQGS